MTQTFPGTYPSEFSILSKDGEFPDRAPEFLKSGISSSGQVSGMVMSEGDIENGTPHFLARLRASKNINISGDLLLPCVVAAARLASRP